VVASAFDLLIIERYNIAWGIDDKVGGAFLLPYSLRFHACVCVGMFLDCGAFPVFGSFFLMSCNEDLCACPSRAATPPHQSFI